MDGEEASRAKAGFLEKEIMSLASTVYGLWVKMDGRDILEPSSHVRMVKTFYSGFAIVKV